MTFRMADPSVDATARRFVEAGGKEVQAVADQCYGDRAGKFEDPFGHDWWLSTHEEDVSPEEKRRPRPCIRSRELGTRCGPGIEDP